MSNLERPSKTDVTRGPDDADAEQLWHQVLHSSRGIGVMAASAIQTSHDFVPRLARHEIVA